MLFHLQPIPSVAVIVTVVVTIVITSAVAVAANVTCY